MALIGVNPVAAKPEKEEESIWDKVLKGLNIAKTGFGIAVDIDALKTQASNRETHELTRKNLTLEGDTKALEKEIASGTLAGGVTTKDALAKGYVPDENGSVLLPTIGAGGKLIPTKYRQIDGLDSTLKKLEIDKHLREGALAPGKMKAQELEIKAKEEALNTPSQGQSGAALFAKRMEQANSVLDSLEESGFDRSSYKAGIQSLLPGVAKPSELQQQEQAERNFVSALLRKESGAAISPKEYETAAPQYFDRAGDSPEVRAQKKANRLLAIEGIRAEAGKAYDKIPSVPVPQSDKKPSSGPVPEAIAAPKAPKAGDVDGGYRFKGGNPADKKNWEKI